MEVVRLNDRFLAEWFNSEDSIEAHTSGSTGTPKAIRLSKEDMRQSARATNRRFGIDSRSLLVCPLSTDYIAGKMMVVRALEAGCRIELTEPKRELDLSRYERISLLAVVPSQLESVMPQADRIDACIVGGAPVSEAMESRLPPWFYMTYGMTETCSHVALRRAGDPCYEALPGIRFGTDSRGCLTIRMEGRRMDSIFTNDMVELRDPRSFRWLGRADNVVISDARKLHPELLERRVGYPGLWYLTGRTSSLRGEELVAVADPTVDVNALRQSIEATLDKRDRPHEIIIRTIRLTSTGKLVRERVK